VTDDTTRTVQEPRASKERPDARRLGLVVAFCTEPGRTGEVFIVEDDEAILGRGGPRDDDPAVRLLPVRQRPGRNEARPPLESPFLSRVQLKVRRAGNELKLENLGRVALRDEAGRDVKNLALAPGGLAALGDQMVFLCVERPGRLAASTIDERAWPAFGEPDADGIVGESVPAWKLRDAVAFLGGRAAHVLVLGPSGSGKELAAQAIHRASPRRAKRLVARNAATIPATLVEAELFGNAANYPNSGMPERPGLVGEAEGSTLFLDEIGELPEELQTKLLRLLDDAGEYQRLGDARRRNADVRMVGATNRKLDALRHDLAARLKLRLTLPGLDERREDIPLIARHLLRRIASNDPAIGARFFEGWNGKTGEPRMTAALVRTLVRHAYTTHIRELDALLWLSISGSTGDVLDVTPELESEVARPVAPRTAVTEISEADVRAALEKAGGKREQAWRDLGLANRHVLKRLIKKYGIETGGDDDGD
jgi:two-component system nitrogen regulation response regulator GlnG/two-component system response regulator HydG